MQGNWSRILQNRDIMREVFSYVEPDLVCSPDQSILWGLKFLKGSAGDSWSPDNEVQGTLLILLQKSFPDMNATTLRRRIEEFEIIVKADIVSSAIHIILRNLF
jgi:hypothetical protein